MDPLDRVDPNSRPRSTWREEVVGASGMNVVLGLWLMCSPALVGYDSIGSLRTEVLVGALVTVCAAVRIGSGVRRPAWSWVNLVLGLWLVGHGTLSALPSVAALNQTASGILVVCLAALSIGASGSAARGAGVTARRPLGPGRSR